MSPVTTAVRASVTLGQPLPFYLHQHIAEREQRHHGKKADRVDAGQSFDLAVGGQENRDTKTQEA